MKTGMKHIALLGALGALFIGPVALAAPAPLAPPGIDGVAIPAARGTITTILHQQSQLVVQDLVFAVDADTRITGSYRQPLAFRSLERGMRVKIYLRGQAADAFYADRIEVER